MGNATAASPIATHEGEIDDDKKDAAGPVLFAGISRLSTAVRSGHRKLSQER